MATYTSNCCTEHADRTVRDEAEMFRVRRMVEAAAEAHTIRACRIMVRDCAGRGWG